MSVESDQPVTGEPIIYDRWRDTETAGAVWAVARAVCDGQITWTTEPLDVEQLDLLTGI